PVVLIAASDVGLVLLERTAVEGLAPRDAGYLVHTALERAAHKHQVEQLIAETEMLHPRQYADTEELNDAAVVVAEPDEIREAALAQVIDVGDTLRVDDTDHLAVHFEHPLAERVGLDP